MGSGDLHVKVKVKTPSSITERQRVLLRALAAEFGEKVPQPSAKEKSIIDRIVDEVKGAVL